ncbi:MAG: class I SAM-dependent methyltransferase [Bacteroidia bacterium]|nr:class I SAM-dependent methyltransferase [Bacteroidia bacterium]
MWSKFLKIFKSKNSESDDFIKRIRSLVIGEGMLKEGNIRLMNFAVKNMPAEGSVVEIGSYGGLSTNLIIYLMRKHKKSNSFFTCDAWVYEGFNDHLQEISDVHIDGRTDILRTDYSVYLKNAFINSTTFLSPQNLPYSFHMFSDLFFDNWHNCRSESDIFGRKVELGGNICFAYIDGGHSYEVAWKDFNNIAIHIVKGGFILLDDSADGENFGSAHMMTNIKKDKRFKVIAKSPTYLIQKVE